MSLLYVDLGTLNEWVVKVHVFLGYNLNSKITTLYLHDVLWFRAFDINDFMRSLTTTSKIGIPLPLPSITDEESGAQFFRLAQEVHL